MTGLIPVTGEMYRRNGKWILCLYGPQWVLKEFDDEQRVQDGNKLSITGTAWQSGSDQMSIAINSTRLDYGTPGVIISDSTK